MALSPSALKLLDLIEDLEMKSLAWGFANGSLSEEETLDLIGGGDEAEDVLEELIDAHLVVELLSVTNEPRYRSRFAEAIRLYKLPPQNIIVFYDELDLTPGKLRMKTGGGLAGHNGLKSLKAHIGADFRRARLGIGHPGHKDQVLGHVLKDFSTADSKWLPFFLDALAEHAPLLFSGEDATYQNRVHEDMADILSPAKPSTTKTQTQE